MKTILLTTLLVLLATGYASGDSTSWGPPTLACAGVAYGMHGPADGEWFTMAGAGAKVAQLDRGAIYLCYQYTATERSDWGGNGGRVLLLDECKEVPQLTLGVGLGYLDRIREAEDGHKLAGLTFEGIVSADLTDWLDLTVLAVAADGGPEFHFLGSILLTLKAPGSLPSVL